MKNKLSRLSIYAAAVLVTFAGLTACEDEPDRFELADGLPSVYYVRPVKAAQADSLLTGAYMGNSICIVGENLRSVYQLDFNDVTATLNNSYITDNIFSFISFRVYFNTGKINTSEKPGLQNSQT